MCRFSRTALPISIAIEQVGKSWLEQAPKIAARRSLHGFHSRWWLSQRGPLRPHNHDKPLPQWIFTRLTFHARLRRWSWSLLWHEYRWVAARPRLWAALLGRRAVVSRAEIAVGCGRLPLAFLELRSWLIA